MCKALGSLAFAPRNHRPMWSHQIIKWNQANRGPTLRQGMGAYPLEVPFELISGKHVTAAQVKGQGASTGQGDSMVKRHKEHLVCARNTPLVGELEEEGGLC